MKLREVIPGRAKVVVGGMAEGKALISSQPITFFGGVDPRTGEVVEDGHEIRGERLSHKVLVFPHGKGRTVGSYVLYSLAKRGVAPAAIINERFDAIIASGCIISGIPLLIVPGMSLDRIRKGDKIRIDGRDGRIEVLGRGSRKRP